MGTLVKLYHCHDLTWTCHNLTRTSPALGNGNSPALAFASVQQSPLKFFYYAVGFLFGNQTCHNNLHLSQLHSEGCCLSSLSLSLGVFCLNNILFKDYTRATNSYLTSIGTGVFYLNPNLAVTQHFLPTHPGHNLVLDLNRRSSSEVVRIASTISLTRRFYDVFLTRFPCCPCAYRTRAEMRHDGLSLQLKVHVISMS